MQIEIAAEQVNLAHEWSIISSCREACLETQCKSPGRPERKQQV